MRVKEIHFNYGPASGAIPIGYAPAAGTEEGAPVPITAPEWADGVSKPVAYARNGIRGPIQILVKFSDGPAEKRLKIRALAPIDYQRPPAGTTRTQTLLGDVKEQWVTFDAHGDSIRLYTFDVTARIEAPVGINEATWRWQAQVHGGGEWHDFVTTSNKVYVTMLMPASPWLTLGVQTVNIVWIEALELGCQWAAGAQSSEQVIWMIAGVLNNHQQLVYSRFDQTYWDPMTHQYLFHNFYANLRTQGVFTIDCRGIALALITVSAALGVPLLLLTIRKSTANNSGSKMFTTLPVKPLREGWTTELWGWHEVGVDPTSPVVDLTGNVLGVVTVGQILIGDQAQELLVYDACLQLNQNASVFPMRMRLGIAVSGDGSYRDLVMAHKVDGDQVDPNDSWPPI